MDGCSVPGVYIGKQAFACVVQCVDQKGGYIVAVPARKKGLLATEVAVMMIHHLLTVFGVPRPTTVDLSSLAAGSRPCVPSWGYGCQERRLSQLVQ